mmetsp:Transcript_19420/g.54672  ORF Transcript_19420/g.54672 Transcript_19420/m.54672 type:complete len:94 (+) Transcript_19420:1-282(+)
MGRASAAEATAEEARALAAKAEEAIAAVDGAEGRAELAETVVLATCATLALMECGVAFWSRDMYRKWLAQKRELGRSWRRAQVAQRRAQPPPV